MYLKIITLAICPRFHLYKCKSNCQKIIRCYGINQVQVYNQGLYGECAFAIKNIQQNRT